MISIMLTVCLRRVQNMDSRDYEYQLGIYGQSMDGRHDFQQ